MIKKKTIFVILLLSFFAKRERLYAKNNIVFNKYVENYCNFPYHTYVGLPRKNDEGEYLLNKASNIMFIFSLLLEGSSGGPLLVQLAGALFLYVNVFSKCVIKSFQSRQWGRGMFFLSTSILNGVSPFFPKYIAIIGQYKKCKILLKLNFESGYYRVSDQNTDQEKFYIFKSKKVNGKYKEFDVNNLEDNCSICMDTLLSSKNGNEENDSVKKNITNLGCCKASLYHTACISQWYYRNAVCPICKAAFKRCKVEEEAEGNEEKALTAVASKVLRENANLLCSFFSCQSFFMGMVYGDITLCIDNYFDMIKYNSDKTYKAFEIILFRAGFQVISSHPTYRPCPFVGFCGISILYDFITVSVVPTYMLEKSDNMIYPGKFFLDIQLQISLMYKLHTLDT